MKTLVSNVTITEMTMDPTGPIVFCKLLVHGGDQIGTSITCYVAGGAAEQLRSYFRTDCTASVEVELLFGLTFGRLIRVGFYKPSDDLDDAGDEQPPMAVPFGNLDAYSIHCYIYRAPNMFTSAVCWKPWGFKHPSSGV